MVETVPGSVDDSIREKFALDVFKLSAPYVSGDDLFKAKKELIVFNIFYRKPLYVVFDIATMVSYFNCNASMMLSFNVGSVKYKLVSIIEHRGMHYVNVFIKDGKGYVYNDLTFDVSVISLNDVNWSEVSIYCFMRVDGQWENSEIPPLFETFRGLKEMDMCDSCDNEPYFDALSATKSNRIAFDALSATKSNRIAFDEPCPECEIDEMDNEYDYTDVETDMEEEDAVDEDVISDVSDMYYDDCEEDEDVEEDYQQYIPYNAFDEYNAENEYLSEYDDDDSEEELDEDMEEDYE